MLSFQPPKIIYMWTYRYSKITTDTGLKWIRFKEVLPHPSCYFSAYTRSFILPIVFVKWKHFLRERKSELNQQITPKNAETYWTKQLSWPVDATAKKTKQIRVDNTSLVPCFLFAGKKKFIRNENQIKGAFF